MYITGHLPDELSLGKAKAGGTEKLQRQKRRDGAISRLWERTEDLTIYLTCCGLKEMFSVSHIKLTQALLSEGLTSNQATYMESPSR